MHSMIRNSHRRGFVKKAVLRSFAKFTGKTPAKFLKTPFLQGTPGRLLLNDAFQVMHVGESARNLVSI